VAEGFADVGSDDLASAVDNARPEGSAQCKKPKWCGPLGLALMAERAGQSQIPQSPEEKPRTHSAKLHGESSRS
jgi:hypothetical protein